MTTVPTVSPTELIRSSWGNTVATELNTKTVKVDGSMPMTGPLIINATPAALRLRRTGDAPYLQFENTTGATRFGYVQGAANRLTYSVDGAAGIHQFLVNSVQQFKVDATGVAATAGLDVTGGALRIGSNGGQLSLIDTSTSGSDFHDVYVSFFGAGVSMVSPGTRTGYVGYAGTTTLQVHNEIAGGAVSLVTTGAGAIVSTTETGPITLNAGGAGDIVATAGGKILLTAGGAERGRVTGTQLLWGKTASGLGTAGVELGAGTVSSTTAANGSPNLYLRHLTDADGAAYVQFVKADGNIVSQITQDNTAPVGIAISNAAVTAPSDARLKNDLGVIEQATARLGRLRTHRFTWKAHPDRVRDGFFADEVAAVIPEAVTGAPDAVDGNGAVIAQQLDRSALIPLLTAAVQEIAARLDVLEAN